MAPKTKGVPVPTPVKDSHPAANVSTSNGVLTDTALPPGGPAVNKKKQKRRQKEALRAASQQHDNDPLPLDNPHLNGHPPQAPPAPAQYEDPNFAADPYDHEHGDYAYSDEEEAYDYNAAYRASNGLDLGNGSGSVSRKKKKGKASAAAADLHAATYAMSRDRQAAHHLPHPDMRHVPRRTADPMWDTNSIEERKRIKQFWLDLPEEKRRSLVNIEKRHVLEKMKEQQKHSCSCTVCGRKRNAIEEELEVLLQDPRIWADPTNPANASHSQLPARPGRSRITELPDEEGDDADELDEDSYSEDDDEYDDDYSSDRADDGLTNPDVAQQARNFFKFGSSLHVKADGILTVAEDLLKNDGQKFIDMMEMLAEKRIQREEMSRYGPAPGHHHHHSHGGLPSHNHSHAGALPPEEEDEEDYDSEEYDDDEYDDEDDDDEMDQMTEDQRMEEGRKMFQIFAARMFEQRVVQAYKEMVAEERQRALIEEEFGGKENEGSSEAKRAKAAEKKKRQREKAKETKSAKDAAKEAEKQKKETAAREAEEKKKEEQRLKQEEARKRKEAEREALAEKKRQKDAEVQKRLDTERERHQEQERKAREQKAEEKRKREAAERQKREEKEARDKEMREQKAHLEAQQREDASRRSEQSQFKATPAADGQASNTLKRAAVPAAIALPPTLKSRASYADSPQAKVATPALPKAPTPVKQREAPSRHTSTPHTPERTPHSKQSSSPKSNASQPTHPPSIPPSRTASQHAFSQQPTMSPMRPIQPPPGMHHPGYGAPGMHPIGGFSGQGQARQGYYGAPPMHSPMYQQQRPFMPNAPPGMMPPGMQHPHHPSGPGFGAFGGQPPPLSTQQYNQQPLTQPIGQARDPGALPHSRQPSAHLESPQPESSTSAGAPAPISRPAPIKRPASVKPGQKSSADVDELSNHLGSSALIGDDDEPLPSVTNEIRRPSAAPGQPTSAALGGFGSPLDQLTSPFSRAPAHDTWSRTPFGPPGIGSHSNWSQQQSGWGGFSSNQQPSRPIGQRPGNVRMYTVQSCRFLASANRADEAGYLDYAEVAQHTMESSRRLNLDPPIRPDEIEIIIDTLGDNQNGGGTFHHIKDKNGRGLIKWVDDRAASGSNHGQPGPPGLRTSGLGLLGEIGSPRVESSMPNMSGLRGFH